MNSGYSARRWIALLFALSVAVVTACDSGTVQPPRPTTLTLTPVGPIPLLVGQTSSLTATVLNNTNTAVSFVSSAPAVATVDPATGVVRALSAGNSTITATSVAEPNARSTVLIVVSPSGGQVEPVNLSIQSLTNSTGGPLDFGNAAGQINVLVNANVPAGTRIDSLQIVLDGIVACSQPFTPTGTAQLISCPFNSAEFNPATGVTRFANRSHALQARLRTAGTTTLLTAGLSITLRNTSFLQATLTPSRGTRAGGIEPGPGNLAPGLVWSAGSIAVTMMPVIYAEGGNAGAGGIAQAVVSLTTSGRGVTGEANCEPTGNRATDRTIAAANGGAGGQGSNAGVTPNCTFSSAAQTDTDPSNGFSFAFPETLRMSEGGVRGVEDVINVVITAVTNGGNAGPACVNPNPTTNLQNPPAGRAACGNAFVIDPASQLRLDNLGPRVAVLDATPVTLGCGATQACFINSPTRLTSTSVTVDYGVDSQTNTFAFGTNPAALQTLPDAFTLVNETTLSTDYFFAVTSVDALGNTSGLRFATDAAGIVSASATAVPPGATRIQKFGVDL